MSLLLSVLGFAVQLFVACSSIALIIDMHEAASSQELSSIGEDHPSGAELSVDSNGVDATLPCASSYCAKSMMSAVITTTISDDVVADDYSALTIRQLKALCKDRHIKGYSSLRKHELVALLSAL